MKRYFNTTGICKPDRHYMVRLDKRVRQIKERYVDRGDYFVINRGRQYGKTTTLRALTDYLQKDYIAVFMDFQRMSSAMFADENSFAVSFAEYFNEVIKYSTDDIGGQELQRLDDLISGGQLNMGKLFMLLGKICDSAKRPVVLIIDEVDSALNNQVFIDFLAQLRSHYLDRDNTPAFWSVILAGVYDIKNLKLKIRSESEHQYNSPWNIAAKFNVQMSFTAGQIAAMLQEYETDMHTGMDTECIAQYIYDYTSGYPYLVSAICKFMDEELPGHDGFESLKCVWTKAGIEEAVKAVLDEKAPLFESMVRQLYEYPEMKQMLLLVLFQGQRISYNSDNQAISLAQMFGYVENREGSVQISNRIFETRLYNLFLSEEELTNTIYKRSQGERSRFICSNRLNMDLVLEKFVEYFNDIYGKNDEKFVEESGRKLFLLYLKPIINGTGNYYIEAHTRDAKRTDVIVDYHGEQFIIEMKIWHGNEYNERGEGQLADYLDYYHKDKGYMLSFNFNKKKETGIKEVRVKGKTIIEAVV